MIALKDGHILAPAIHIQKKTSRFLNRSFFYLVGTRDYSALRLSCTGAHSLRSPAYSRPPFAGSQTSRRRFKSCARHSDTKKDQSISQPVFFFIWSATTSKPTTPDTAVSNFLFLTLIIAK